MSDRNTQYDAICVVKIERCGYSEFWAMRVQASAVPGYSAVDHLDDLAVDLSGIEGEVYESFKAAKAAAGKCVKSVVTTTSGERFSAPKIRLAIKQSAGFHQSRETALAGMDEEVTT